MAERHLSVRLRQTAPIPLDVEFECSAGDVLAVFGPSGSGKTTILRAIAGLHRPAHASIRADGVTWADTGANVCVPPHRRAVGFVFQDYALFPHLTAVGNVIAALGHRPRTERQARARQLLASVHLSAQVDRRPHQLSGGERQRVALARALAREPAVLLLDEPFAAVDRTVRRHLQAEIEDLRRLVDIPIVLVTHDFDDVIRLATHLLILEQGRSVAHGSLTSLMSRPDLAWLRDAVGLGSVIETVVSQAHASRGLTELGFDGGALLVSSPPVAIGTTVRVRIPAREVILARQRPDGLSLHNTLSGTVSAIHTDPAFEYVMVQIAVGSVRLLAEVTRDAIERLPVTVGQQIFALIKSVSIDVRGIDVSSPGESDAGVARLSDVRST